MRVVYNFGLFADNEVPLLFLVEAASNCELIDSPRWLICEGR